MGECNKRAVCEYCQSNNSSFIGYREHEEGFSISKKDTFGIYRCNNCWLYFNFPRPTPEDLTKFFEQEYHSVRYGGTLQDLLRGYPRHTMLTASIVHMKKIAKRFLAKICNAKDIDIDKLIRKHLNISANKKPAVVEIGTGSAPLLYLIYMGYNYTGIEPAKELVDIFNRKGYQDIRQGVGEKLDFIDRESIDVIIFIGTLSHVFDIKLVLKECQRILKSEGIIIINDSNADRDVPRNIEGGYTNYGFPRIFLEKSLAGFKLKDYFYLDDKKRYDQNGCRMLAILEKIDI